MTPELRDDDVESEHNVLTKCPNCGATLSIETAEEAKEEHELEAKAEGPSIRDALTGAMGV
jgi:hypothetical protein